MGSQYTIRNTANHPLFWDEEEQILTQRPDGEFTLFNLRRDAKDILDIVSEKIKKSVSASSKVDPSKNFSIVKEE